MKPTKTRYTRRNVIRIGAASVATTATVLPVGTVGARQGGQGWIGTGSYREKLDNGNKPFAITGVTHHGILVEASGKRGQGGEKNEYDAYRIVTEDGGQSLIFVNSNRNINSDPEQLYRIVQTMDQFQVEDHPHYYWAAEGERTEEDKPRTLRRVAFAPKN